MLGKREITVKLGKKENEDGNVDEPIDDRPIEEKTAAVLHVLEKVAIKAFAGVCIFVILDTHRRVAVAKASNPRY